MIQRRQEHRTILASGYFDPGYYLDHYPDVQAAGMKPIEHFLRHGAQEGRNPSEKFDSSFYLNTYPDVRSAGVNPLVHYLQHGIRENRAPLPVAAITASPQANETEPAPEIHTINIDYTIRVVFPPSLPIHPYLPAGSPEQINTWFDEIYVINLKSRKDRLRNILSRLSRLNIRAQIVEAIEGRDLPHLYEYQQYKKMPPGGSNAPPYEKADKVKAIVSPGAWGLIKTYRMILHHALAMGHKKILVLEDDAVFVKEFHRKFREFTEAFGERSWKIIAPGVSQHQWQIPLNLTYDDKSIRDYSPEQPWYHPLTSRGSFALGINSSVFPMLITEMEKMNRPADRVFHSVYETWNDQCYVVQPNLIIADIADSDIFTIERPSPSIFYEKQKWDIAQYDFTPGP